MAIKRIMFFFVCMAAFFQPLWTMVAKAEEINEDKKQEERATHLEKVVVTATRSAKDLETAPGSVSVITREEIESRNIKTVDEALNLTPGVTSTRSKGYMDTHASVNMRGFTGQNRTLVLLDGMVFNDPYSGMVLWPAVSPENIGQIEVLKGPASSLYGGYAMGGVINLITRFPDKRELVLKSGYGGGMAGSDTMGNVRKVFVSFGDRIKDRFSFLVSNNYTATDGYAGTYNTQTSSPGTAYSGWSSTTDRKGAIKYLIGDKGNNGYWHDNFALKMRYDFSPVTSANFTFMRSQNEYSYSDPDTYLRDSGGRRIWSYGSVREASFLSGPGGDEQYIYNLSAETEFSPVKLKLLLACFDQAHGWYITPNSSTATRNGGPGKYSDAPSSAYSGDLQAVMPLLSRHLLTLGGSFRTGNINVKEYDLADWRNDSDRGAMTYEIKGSDRTFALFAQDEITLLDNLTLYAGVRQDWWETFDGYVNQTSPTVLEESYNSRSNTSFSPKGAIVYKPFDKTTFRVSGGKAFRAPTLYELYRTVQDHGGRTTSGNPDLKPETTLSWDAGVEQKLWSGATAKATYFENYIKDMIYSKTITSTYTTKVNAGRAESKGVELEFEQKIDSLVRLFANYTYTDAVIKENNASPASVGKKVTGIPPHMVNLGADVRYGQFSGIITGRYASKRHGDDDNSDDVNGVYGAYDEFFTVDLKLSYKITPWAKASFSIDNLLDKQYFLYYKAPGRSCLGELTFTF
jgi:iron complex outermembrane receptor protein